MGQVTEGLTPHLSAQEGNYFAPRRSLWEGVCPIDTELRPELPTW